eukprot:99696_1
MSEMTSKMKSNVYHSIEHHSNCLDLEEENYGANNLDHISFYQNATDFVQFHADDYISCNGNMSTCRAIQRVVHFLAYYKQRQSNNLKNDNVHLYEYMESLGQYNSSTLMEDWYHSKASHFSSQDDYIWFKNKKINCNYQNCEYFRQYQRHRAREIYSVDIEIDHKNVILADVIASIHSFIFHSVW